MGLENMKLNEKSPPREYNVGLENQITIKDCGSIQLEYDEQVTFNTKSGKEYDLARKDWGYYATPSINGRLKNFGFKTALVKNSNGRLYIMIVDNEKMDLFESYLIEEEQEVLEWLNDR